MSKIRKFAVFLAFVLLESCFFTKIHAQEEDDDVQRVFYGGVLVGSNFCQVDGDYFAGYYKAGLNVGGIVYGQLAKHVALSLEILYSQKGSKSGNERVVNVNTTSYIIQDYGISLGYAEIPVMLNYFDKRKSHFGAGFSYSQLVSSSEKLQTNPTPAPVDLTKYPFKKYDVNFLIGTEMHLYKGLFLNVRFQYSILPIRVNIPPGFSRSEQFNNLWVVRLMYLLK